MSRRRRIAWRAVRWVGLAALLGLAVALVRRAHEAGDSWEYQCMLESWFRHLSPDQRAGDIAKIGEILAHHGAAAHARDGFFVTPHGRWFSYHFWLYPLLGLPAKAIAHLARADEYFALPWTNAALLVGCVAFAIRKAPSRRRIAFVLLSVASPVVWYVAWPHAELFEWAFVVTSLCCWEEGRPACAAALAAVASMESPPIALLALVYVALEAAARRWRSAATAAAVASVAVIPVLFYRLTFGCSSLLLATGMALPRLASAGRTAALWLDLDQGMIAYVPATLILAAFGLFAAKGTRRLEAAAFVGASIGMAVLASQTCNFNAGCAGMNRYGTWIAPILAFVATRRLVFRRAGIAVVGLGVLAQALLATRLDGDDDAVVHHAAAAWALHVAPRWYRPEVETFSERTTGMAVDWPFASLPLPIAYGGQRVDQLLVDRETLAHLDRWFDVRTGWLAAANARYAGASGVFYVAPAGAVRRRAPPPPFEGVAFGAGWYGPEGAPPHQVRWLSRRGDLVVRRDVFGASVRFVGVVPAEIAPPTVRVLVRGVEVDRFVTPPRTFARDEALPPGGGADVDVTLEVSSSFHAPDGRDLGFALMGAVPALVRRSVGGEGVRWRGDWHEPFGVPPHDARCMGASASIDVRPAARGRTLWVFVLDDVAERDRPSEWTVTIDGRVREHGPLFRVARRAWSIAPNAAHTIRFDAGPIGDGIEPHAALCFGALRLTGD